MDTPLATDEHAAPNGQIDADKLAAMTMQINAAFELADKTLVAVLKNEMQRAALDRTNPFQRRE